MKEPLFTWDNCKFLIKELVKIYSWKESYFSKKRFESGFAFVIAEWGMVRWLIENIDKIAVSEICIWAAVNFSIAGWIVNKIEKQAINDAKP